MVRKSNDKNMCDKKSSHIGQQSVNIILCYMNILS